MSSDQKDTATKKKRPSGKRKTLIALLILSLIFGCIVGVYFLSLSSSGFGASIKKSLNEFPVKNLSNLSDILQKKIANKEPDIVLTFQGTLMGEQGAIAIINDQMVAVGADIHGIRIVEINNRRLVIDHLGETQTLTLGETVTLIQN